MEERNDRKNTMLLTVIAIATLLVAVIGATFAYFTATISGRETASTVEVTGATLTITFADGGSSVQTPADNNVNPVKINGSEYAPIITKNFKLTGTNTTSTGTTPDTTGKQMPYDLYLIVTENTFQLIDGTKTSLQYKLVNNDTSKTGSIVSSNDFVNIPAKTLATASDCTAAGTYCDGQTHNGETFESLQTTALGNVSVYNGGVDPILTTTGLLIGHGYFPAASANVIHDYTLKIYFNETTKNQDFDKNKTFEGYVVVSAGDAGTKLQ